MSKYDKCGDAKLVNTPQKIYIMRCELKKRHEGDHRQAEKEWENADNRTGSR